MIYEGNKTLKTIIANDATFELRKVRLCSSVVWAWLHGDSSKTKESIVALQNEIGNGWSLTSAMQFMSGKHAKVALEQGNAEEQVSMLMAHQITREVCSKYGLGAVSSLNDAGVAELRALIEAKQYQT